MSRELVVYADESTSAGAYYSNFYGGALVESAHLKEVVDRLEAAKLEQRFFGEVKWAKVTGNYLDKYINLVDVAFDLVEERKMKLRVMFTQNYRRAANLSDYHREHAYHILYYQFLKHAFGLEFAASRPARTRIRYYLDHLPDTAGRDPDVESGIHLTHAARR